MIRNVKHAELNISIMAVFLHTQILKIIAEYKCLSCNKSYQRKVYQKLKERFFNIYKFLTMITISLFRYYEKVFILNEYMDDWGKFIETSLPEKGYCFSHLNTEVITDTDYVHAQRACKGFEIKNLREYHNLHVQSDTLLLVDVFESFRNMCLEIYDLDPAKETSAPELAW